jgi:Yos1-like
MNSLAILNPRYFLKHCNSKIDGLASIEDIDGYTNPMKKQLAFLLYASRVYGRSNYYAVPLIFLNLFLILMEIIVG